MNTHSRLRFSLNLGIVALLIAVLLLGSSLPAAAQGRDPLPPAIIKFTADLVSVKLADIEAGKVTVTFSWQTIGLTADYQLLLYAFRVNDWALVTQQSLPASGAAKMPMQPTQDFASPSFRLAIVNKSSQVISQQIVVIPYDASAEAISPTIDAFTTDVQSVNANVVTSGTARINVSWRVSNRLPTSNLMFDQIMPDGTSHTAELPRLNRWIDSTGQGVVAPTSPGANAVSIQIRLRVVDMRDGRVYQEQTINVPITGGNSAPAVQVATPTTTPLPEPAATP